MRVVHLTLRIVSKVDLLYIRIIMDVYTACHYNVPITEQVFFLFL